MPKLYKAICKICQKPYRGRGKTYCSYKCMYTSQKNEGNNAWVGDKIGYMGLHNWVKRHLSKPEKCENCGSNKPLDLACITGTYDRAFSNWKYLCRSCHWKHDGKIKNIGNKKRDLKGKKQWWATKRLNKTSMTRYGHPLGL